MIRTRYMSTYTTIGVFADSKVGQANLSSSDWGEVVASAPTDDWQSAIVSEINEELFTNEDGTREIWLNSGSNTKYTLFIGDVYDTLDIQQMNTDGSYDSLLSNMSGNHWDRVVKTRFGEFRPIDSGDPTPLTVAQLEHMMGTANDSTRNRS